MTNQEYGKIISKNLKRIAYDNQKTQADIARDLNLKQATVSSWMNGTRVPRMEKIDLLCHYFNVPRRDLMEPNGGTKEPFIVEIEHICKRLNQDGLERLMEYARLLDEASQFKKDTPQAKTAT